MRAVHGDWQNPRKYQVIEFLLSQPRLEVNKQDYSGATALVYAVDAADSQAARLILAHPCADPTIRTWAGQCSGGWHGGWQAGNAPWILWTVFKFMARERFAMR